ncbi:BGTF surface domain-containing protein, partial [Halorussus marinus]|uniref:BGTF surface domain-containing protein n=1 Tax=Halorussus marinus TaxID=2505976 RepID=UPI0034A2F604
NSNVFLNVTETNTGPNAVATAYDYDDVDTAYYDAENNTVYYAFQTGNNGLSADANYNAEMKVFKGNDAYTSTQNASADFEVAEQNIEITGLNSSDVLELEAGENSTVMGETNLAPGTPITVEVETDGQLYTQTVDVQSDGTFSANFDLSEYDVGTQLTRVYAEGGDTDDEVTDAVLVESMSDDDGEGDETTTEETT